LLPAPNGSELVKLTLGIRLIVLSTTIRRTGARSAPGVMTPWPSHRIGATIPTLMSPMTTIVSFQSRSTLSIMLHDGGGQ
jgi:hypothetical protein